MNYQEHAHCSRNNLEDFKFENFKISLCHYCYIHHPCNAFTFRHVYPHCRVRRGPDQLGARPPEEAEVIEEVLEAEETTGDAADKADLDINDEERAPARAEDGALC